MSKKKIPAMGRGLSALIGDIKSELSEEHDLHDLSPTEKATTNVEVEIDLIDANPNQPRTTFDSESLTELSESIKVHGIIQPLTLRLLENGRFQIISGERRFRASKLIGLETVPAYVRIANDQETLEMALIENIQREDLDAMEVAFTYQRLMDECELTQELLSDRVGKKRATVANYLRLINLPAEIQEYIKDKKISMGHARAIVALDSISAQRKLARKIIDNGLSVRQTEEAVKKANAPEQEKEDKIEQELPDEYYTVIELMGKYFNNKVSIKRNEKGKGSITIPFDSDKDILGFIEKLEKE